MGTERHFEIPTPTEPATTMTLTLTLTLTLYTDKLLGIGDGSFLPIEKDTVFLSVCVSVMVSKRIHFKITMLPFFLTPKETLVLIVGINSEFEIGRAKGGDEAFHRFFVDKHNFIPDDQIIFLKDDKATLPTIQYHFSKLLLQHPTAESLVIYYGGHGLPTHFCTQQGNWKHVDVISTIEKEFQGTKVFLLIDCCCSGNFLDVLAQTTKKQYIVFLSTLADCTAGPEWTMTETFLKHYHQPLEILIRHTARQMMKIKRECFRVALHNVDPTVLQLMPAETTMTTMTHHHDKSTTEQPFPLTFPVTLPLQIHAQWIGGTLPGQNQYLPPLYFPAKTLQIQNHDIKVEFHHNNTAWTAKVQRAQVVPSYMVHNSILLPEFFRNAQIEMSGKRQWLDFSMIEGTELWYVRWDNVLRGKVVRFTHVHWKSVVRDLRQYGDVMGGYIPIQLVNKTITLVPRHHCTLCSECNDKDIARAIVETTIPPLLPDSPQEAMLWSMASAGKFLVTENVKHMVRCWWTDDNQWYAIKPVEYQWHELPIKWLVNHVKYTEAGDFCIVQWVEDRSISIVPLANLCDQETA